LEAQRLKNMVPCESWCDGVRHDFSIHNFINHLIDKSLARKPRGLLRGTREAGSLEFVFFLLAVCDPIMDRLGGSFLLINRLHMKIILS